MKITKIKIPVMKTKGIGLIVLLACMVAAVETFAQSKPFMVPLNSSFQKLLPDEEAMYYLELTPIGNELFDGAIYTREKVRVVAKGQYALFNDRYLENGLFTYYSVYGQKESEGEYQKGARIGTWHRYNLDGTEKPTRYYNPEGAAMLRKALGYDKL
jgi:hypothetical protein